MEKWLLLDIHRHAHRHQSNIYIPKDRATDKHSCASRTYIDRVYRTISQEMMDFIDRNENECRGYFPSSAAPPTATTNRHRENSPYNTVKEKSQHALLCVYEYEKLLIRGDFCKCCGVTFKC